MDAAPLQNRDHEELWREFVAARHAGVRDELIEHYLPWARATAARLYRMRDDDSVSFDDYLQYARVGLLEAIDRYDPLREASFETFSSYRIRGSILNGLGKESELAAQREGWRSRTRDRIESLASPAQQDDEQELEALVELTLGLAIGSLLEEAPVEPVDTSVRANPYAATELLQLRNLTSGLVEVLPENERLIIRRHYFEQCEFQAIARELQVSKGRISQLHAQAIGRIRKLLCRAPDLDRTL